MDIIEYVVDKNKEYWATATKHNFRSRIRKYFEILELDISEDYFKKGKDYKKDIDKAWKVIVSKPPCTRNSFLSCIKSFYKYHDIEYKELFWKDLSRKGKGSGAIGMDKVPTNQELKQMLMHTDIRGKSLFVFNATSGMRIDAQLQLTWDDIDLKSHPKLGIVTVPWEYTKKGSARICFITEEAKNLLLEWKKERKEYIKSIGQKLKNLPQVDYEAKLTDPRIWPFSYTSALTLFHDMIRKAGFVEKQKHEIKFTRNGKKFNVHRYKYHIHSMRKFVKTRLSLAGIPERVINFIVGHKGYMAQYDRPDVEELIPFYMKAYSSMLIFEKESTDVTDIRQQLQKKDGQIQKLLESQKIMELEIDIIKNKLEMEKIKNGKKD